MTGNLFSPRIATSEKKLGVRPKNHPRISLFARLHEHFRRQTDKRTHTYSTYFCSPSVVFSQSVGRKGGWKRSCGRGPFFLDGRQSSEMHASTLCETLSLASLHKRLRSMRMVCGAIEYGGCLH